MEVADGGRGLCVIVGLAVCSAVADNTTDLEREQLRQTPGARLASAFGDSTADFDTSVARMTVPAGCFSGSCPFPRICFCEQFSPVLRHQAVCRWVF